MVDKLWVCRLSASREGYEFINNVLFIYTAIILASAQVGVFPIVRGAAETFLFHSESPG